MMNSLMMLLSAHFVADFLLQSDWMAIHKSKSWMALTAHVYVYAVTMAVAAALWTGHFGRFAVLFGILTFLTHFVTDAVTSRMTSRLFPWRPLDKTDIPEGADLASYAYMGVMVPKKGGNRHWFFVVVGFDQLIHAWTLFLTWRWLFDS